MNVKELVEVMGRIAPLEAAEPWDRVGLQVGCPQRDIDGPIVLTIDLTESVLAEAISLGAGAIVAYHCPIWNPLDRLADGTPTERIVRGAIEAQIAVYSPHTALDAARGGVTDWLCEGLCESAPGASAGDSRALTPYVHHNSAEEVKVVTFVPAPALDQVRNALASAGAGHIGAYRVCSFSSPGTGTFFGTEGTAPVVGAPGHLEHVDEHRLEMVCSRDALPLALETLHEFHPYEEPAFDVFELVGKPCRHVGPGRRLVLDRPATMAELADRLKKHLGRARVRYALTGDDAPITTLGVVPGAGESLVATAQAEGCQAFVTGEMRHHEVMAAIHSGVSVLLAGHTNTERGYLPRLAERMREMMPGVEVVQSTADRDVLVIA